MLVSVEWRHAVPMSTAWRATRVLYAYVHPATQQVLYIGKADGRTVGERFDAQDKDVLKRHLRARGLTGVHVFVGVLSLPVGRRLSRELLVDIEGLLIMSIQPPGNVQSKKTRIRRPGLRVRCTGAWPLSNRLFVDGGL